MPTAEAFIATDRASRYLQQLYSHSSRIHHFGHGTPQAEAISDAAARITRGTARCDLTAGPTGLTLRVTADDEEQLRALQEAVTRTLERVGWRDGLKVVWG